MQRKKIALLSGILIATLVVGVYAGLQLSNTLTATFTVVSSTPLQLSWVVNPDGMTFGQGYWHSTAIRLLNPTEATVTSVLLNFTIYAGGYIFPSDSMKIKFNSVVWSGWADPWDNGWIDIPLSGWGSEVLTGTYGTPGGFDCTPGFDATGPFKFMFEGNAPLASYTFNVWVERVP
jgi:hypothetical protein